MRILISILGMLFAAYFAEAQQFDCSIFRTGVYTIESDIDGAKFKYLLSRSKTAQWEVLLYSSVEVPDYMRDTLFTLVNWNDKKCEYTLTTDKERTKASLLEELDSKNDTLLFDITAVENDCFYYRITVPNDETEYKNKMCRLKENEQPTIKEK